jgi:hypothetical protein
LPQNEFFARWFSNPLFAALGKQAKAAVEDKHGIVPKVDAVSSVENNGAKNSKDKISVDNGDSDNEKPKKMAKNRNKSLDADDVFASMPKTNKQICYEKRLKANEHKVRQQACMANILGKTKRHLTWPLPKTMLDLTRRMISWPV